MVDDEKQPQAAEQEEETNGIEPTVGESSSSTELVGTVEMKVGEGAGETLPNSGGSGSGDGDSGDIGENSGEHDGGAAADDDDEDQLPPGQVRLLEYRAPRGAEDEQGGTRYASLGDDVSKFITFLESPVARGGRNGDADELDVAAGAGAGAGGTAAKGTERRIFASTVDVGEDGVQQRLRVLWEEGRLLSQERDAANVLRGQEVCCVCVGVGADRGVLREARAAYGEEKRRESVLRFGNF